MAVGIWCELVCQTCKQSITGQYASKGIPRSDLIQEAESLGAVFDKDEVFCNPTCLETHRYQQPENQSEPDRGQSDALHVAKEKSDV